MSPYREFKIGNVLLCLKIYKKINVDESLIKEVINKSGISNGVISLTLGIQKLSKSEYRGETKPDESPNSKSDVNISIRKDLTDDWEHYEPHIAFALGHELEHARIILKDLRLHYCLTWLSEYNKTIFCEAGNKEPAGKQFDFLHEKQCNLKGKSISIELFGSKNFEECLKRLRGKENNAYNENIDYLLSLEEKPYGNKVCELLKKDIRLHYDGKESAVHKIWKCYPSTNFNLNDFIPPLA